MNNFYPYIIESSISLSVLYAFYYFFLKNETFYTIQRFFLLSSLPLSVLIPFLHFDIEGNQTIANYTINLNTIVIGQNQGVANLGFLQISLIIYFSISLLLFSKTFFNLLNLWYLFLKSPKHKQGRYWVVQNNYTNSSFSFFNIIFYKGLPENIDAQNAIILHEKSHSNQFHSFDILLIELSKALFWINPFVWLLKSEIVKIHEALADQGVLQKGIDKIEYIKLIFKENLYSSSFPLAHNFNQSHIKRRIVMISKQSSKNLKKLKLLISLPLIAGLIIFISCDKNSTKSPEPNSVEEVSTNSVDEFEKQLQNDKIFEEVEEMPMFEGGQDGLIKYLVSNIKYPEESRDNGISGTVKVSFIVATDGSLEDLKVIEAVDPDLDAEAMRVISSMPNWTPGKNKGKVVPVKMNLPIKFALN